MAAGSLSVLFENTAGQLLADPAGFLRADWSAQPRSLADTKALFMQMADALRQQGWCKILVNQAQMPAFSPQEQAWIAQQWLPYAVEKGGYRYGAVLLSTDMYTRLATAYITTSVQGLPLRYRSFDNEQNAIGWLRIKSC